MQKCSHSVTDRIRATDNMFCAGTQAAQGKDTCHGDSGGPYTMRDKTHSPAHLVGLVSWGPNGCDSGLTYFTKVSNYVGWIREHISEGECSGN